MTTFLITYDLANPASNKAAVTAEIMAAGEAWARPLDQTWYVRSDDDAAQIESAIAGHLGDDDGLIVQAIGDEATFANTALRWFRRRPLADAAPRSADILAFPAQPAPAPTDAGPLAA